MHKGENMVPDGHLAKNFSNFHYNVWLQGSADISLSNTSNFAVSMKMNGEAFLFVDNLNAVSIILC